MQLRPPNQFKEGLTWWSRRKPIGLEVKRLILKSEKDTVNNRRLEDIEKGKQNWETETNSYLDPAAWRPQGWSLEKSTYTVYRDLKEEIMKGGERITRFTSTWKPITTIFFFLTTSDSQHRRKLPSGEFSLSTVVLCISVLWLISILKKRRQMVVMATVTPVFRILFYWFNYLIISVLIDNIQLIRITSLISYRF